MSQTPPNSARSLSSATTLHGAVLPLRDTNAWPRRANTQRFAAAIAPPIATPSPARAPKNARPAIAKQSPETSTERIAARIGASPTLLSSAPGGSPPGASGSSGSVFIVLPGGLVRPLVGGGGVALLALLPLGDGLHLGDRAQEGLHRRGTPEGEPDQRDPRIRAELPVQPAPAEEAEAQREHDLEPHRAPAPDRFVLVLHPVRLRGGVQPEGARVNSTRVGWSL